VPTVGGELVFDPSYQGNPLVNVMAIGVAREHELARAAATGPGNLVVLFGSPTGRDGIGGASVLASATFTDDDPSKRPSVQVGDPFAEKLLMEVSLELVGRGLVEGLQDLGAGGITCATSETADRAGTGIAIDLDAVPRRVEGMEPFEVMVSESQERMLAIVRPERWDAVRGVCERWGLPCTVIGRVTRDGDIAVSASGREIARVPARALTSEAIVYERTSAPPARDREAPAPGMAEVPRGRLPQHGQDPGAVLLALLGSSALGSRRWVFEQYDSTVGTRTVAGPGAGAAVMRIHGTRKGLVATTDADAAVGVIDPYLGAVLSVAEATRNISITGARPLGVTDCLNFGDPTRPEAFWQLAEAIRGIGDACRALGVPVVGGNVSLYNESPLGTIAPTPEIGVVGLLDDVDRRLGPAFTGSGESIVLVGEATPGLAGSVYARLAGAAPEDGPPAIDLAREAAVQLFVREVAAAGLATAAQDVSGGGLAVALAEMAIWGGVGARCQVAVGDSPAVALFGESPSRVVVTCAGRQLPALLRLARRRGLPTEELGVTGGERLCLVLRGQGATGAAEERGSTIADDLDVALADLGHAYEHGLPRALGLDTREEG
jgi:phosphoribosylformylglycinamidine synthase